MNWFIVLNSKNLKKILLIIFISFFTALLFYSQSSTNLSVFSSGNNPKAVYKGEKGIALTFNIGWGDEKANTILKVLKKEKVKSATFFLSGAWAERHPDIVEEIVKLGYEIGYLGYAYIDYTEVEDEKIRKDILKAKEVFEKLNVKDIELLRSPTSHFDKRLLKIAHEHDLTVVHWSVNSHDWTNPGVQQIIKNSVKASQGDILLFHASDAAKQTAVALPPIIKELQNKGEFITISEMIANGKTKTKLIP